MAAQVRRVIGAVKAEVAALPCGATSRASGFEAEVALATLGRAAQAKTKGRASASDRGEPMRHSRCWSQSACRTVACSMQPV